MATTTNIGLPLTGTSSADTGMLFSAWRQLINGEGSTSGFNKIDAAIGNIQKLEKLLIPEIPNTTQTVNFENGVVSSIVHKEGNTTVRTDTFVITDAQVTETRTLSTGEVLTVTTNLTTLVTTIALS